MTKKPREINPSKVPFNPFNPDKRTLIKPQGMNVFLESLSEHSKNASDAAKSTNLLQVGLVKLAAAMKIIDAASKIQHSLFLSQYSKERKARGDLGVAYATEAKNMGLFASALSSIPGLGGTITRFHEQWVEKSGLREAIELVQVLEGEYARLAQFRNSLNIGVAGGELGLKYRYTPEELRFQQEILGIKTGPQAEIEGRQAKLDLLKARSQKKESAAIREERAYEKEKDTPRGFGGTIPSFGTDASKARKQADLAREAYETTRAKEEPAIKADKMLVQQLRRQAAERYTTSFFTGMQTVGVGALDERATALVAPGAPAEDPMIQKVEITNDTLLKIEQILLGISKAKGTTLKP